MNPELKLQLFFATFLCLILLGFLLILMRTLTSLEYAISRIDEIASKELRVAGLQLDREKEVAKNAASQTNRHTRNEMLLNIPFMERLSKEKPKG